METTTRHRTTATILTGILLLSLTACGNEPDDNTPSSTTRRTAMSTDIVEQSVGLEPRVSVSIRTSTASVAPETATTAPTTTAEPTEQSPTASAAEPTHEYRRTPSGGRSRSSTKTTCTSLGVVGDSTGVLLTSQADSSFTPGKSGFPLDSLATAGVKDVEYDVLGGRSFVEGATGTNGISAMQRINDRSDPDCWLMIMGTNDAANIAVGSGVGATERINRVMANAAGKPVYWASPVIASFATVNGYNSSIADDFTAALKRYTTKNNKLHVIDSKAAYSNAAGKNGLPSTVDGFFEPDGIHYPAGKIQTFRAQMMAQALN